MPDALVNVIFQADTCSTTAAFAKINCEMAGTGQQTVNWTQVQRINAQAGEFMAQANYKTAASFKPATQAQRAASVATEEFSAKTEHAGRSAGSFISSILAYTLAYSAMRLAIDAVKFSITAIDGA